MNTNQKLTLIAMTGAAASSALITAALYEDRIHKLKNQLRKEKFVSDNMNDAFLAALKRLTKQEAEDVVSEIKEKVMFESIVRNYKK